MLRPLLLILLLIPQLLLASQEVKLEARPRATNEASNIRIRVEPDTRNRQLVLEWYLAEGLENRKFWELKGDQSAIYYTYLIKFTESGDWTVRARVERHDDSRVINATTVLVR